MGIRTTRRGWLARRRREHRAVAEFRAGWRRLAHVRMTQERGDGDRPGDPTRERNDP